MAGKSGIKGDDVSKITDCEGSGWVEELVEGIVCSEEGALLVVLPATIPVANSEDAPGVLLLDRMA